MGKAIFITEKPSVARDFVKLLNVKGIEKNGFVESEKSIFTWCVGHMVTMSYPEAYDPELKRWSLTTLPFLPIEYKYEVIPGVLKQFEIVKTLLNRDDIDTIYVCTDSGREGEYIYRLVDQMAGVKNKEKKRVWIDSQTEEEIKRGIKEAKALEEYDALACSAYLRAKEDYLLGINFSRLLTILYGNTVASVMKEDRAVIAVGRVMSCVLGMIVTREREIRNFVKTPFYKILADFQPGKDNIYKGEWKSEIIFKEKEKAEAFVEELREKSLSEPCKVFNITKSKENKNPPLLFNLAEIQNECSKLFKINPHETLGKIQNLYERKLVTYPRTDARVLSTSVAKQIQKNINLLGGFKQHEAISGFAENIIKNKLYVGIEKSKYVDDSKITDHYAIIPTGEGLDNYASLSDLEKNIYNLIALRFLAIFYPAAKFNKISIETKISDESFITNEKICVSKGYLEVLKPTDDEEEKQVSKIGDIKKGQEVKIVEIFIKEGETSPPKRYSSGSIILAMENAGKLIEDEELREQIKGMGIGTSATRAEILKKLENIDYITTNKKTQILTPTKRGEMVYEVIRDSVPTLLNPILTASWEKGLTMVAKNELLPEEFMKKLQGYIDNNFKNALRNNGIIESKKLFKEVVNEEEIPDVDTSNVIGVCPFCKKGQVVVNKKGYGCTNWKSGCKFFISEICKVSIGRDEVKELLRYGETKAINGFKSKKGNEFSAKLSIRNGEIKLVYLD